MAMSINADECIACGACASDCPTDSITSGIAYEIDAETCTECVGSYKKPHCKQVCPIDGCITQAA